MKFLQRERTALDKALPGLDAELAAHPFTDLESAGGPGLAAFTETGGSALLVPSEHGGYGADLLTAVRVQRAIGSRSPSLAVATTMHHFSVASLVEAAAHTSGLEWMLLAAIAKDRLLLASGFAEGRTGQGILAPNLTARVEGEKVWLSGSKKPCSLAHSMNLLTASVALPGPDGTPQLAIALIPAEAPGLSVRPFWGSPILAGAESDEVVLDDVEVPAELLVRTDVTDDGRLDHLQTVGFVWFELLMTASYLGAASALVERTLANTRVDAAVRAEAATTLEAAALAVEGLAASTEPIGQDTLASALICRYAAQDAINRVLALSVEALGGMAFISSGDIAYLHSACRALAFHPPSRARMAAPLVDALAGEPLRIP
ncbi:acyl-CoA dehydrogenase family protein [Streptomyces erythrochromogenes]|uniref:acyl-CoA dehydrogenase family protein n=1 Tax=Streptomyces erythrochromogenes TaxID=285574 RepID=UPI002258A134|nr:acyl-CoA dehydrogenase family protein [Streptomyces erythrochromogenes]MCX5582921.1 acyl-CoA/acyl-ACP dehydrogenase [Streptomyces erythrochromogenes]